MLRQIDLKATFAEILANPQAHKSEPHFAPLAAALIEYAKQPLPAEPISYRTWGSDIDLAAHEQMKVACEMPMATGAALDARCACRLRPADRRRAGAARTPSARTRSASISPAA